MKYTIEKFCGDTIYNYEGINGKYEVLLPGYGDTSYSLAFFPYKNKCAPVTKCYSWDFIPTGENRYYEKRESLEDIERAIETYERRLK